MTLSAASAQPQLARHEDRLVLSGAMTLSFARQLELSGRELLRGGAVTIDLAAATNVDSTALAVLFSWQRDQQKNGGTLSIASAPAALLSLAQVYGVDDQLSWQ